MTQGNVIDTEDLARCLWAIGDVTRLRLLLLLPKRADCTAGKNVSELAEVLGLSQSSVSNHLSRLRTLGIIKAMRQCRDNYYYIEQDRVSEIINKLKLGLTCPTTNVDAEKLLTKL